MLKCRNVKHTRWLCPTESPSGHAVYQRNKKFTVEQELASLGLSVVAVFCRLRLTIRWHYVSELLKNISCLMEPSRNNRNQMAMLMIMRKVANYHSEKQDRSWKAFSALVRSLDFALKAGGSHGRILGWRWAFRRVTVATAWTRGVQGRNRNWLGGCQSSLGKRQRLLNWTIQWRREERGKKQDFKSARLMP